MPKALSGDKQATEILAILSYPPVAAAWLESGSFLPKIRLTVCVLRAKMPSGKNDCINQETLRPYIFWNPLRQKIRHDMDFNPIQFILSNKEFRNERFGKKKKAKKFYAAVRYEYNALTDTLKPLF